MGQMGPVHHKQLQACTLGQKRSRVTEMTLVLLLCNRRGDPCICSPHAAWLVAGAQQVWCTPTGVPDTVTMSSESGTNTLSMRSSEHQFLCDLESCKVALPEPVFQLSNRQPEPKPRANVATHCSSRGLSKLSWIQPVCQSTFPLRRCPLRGLAYMWPPQVMSWL